MTTDHRLWPRLQRLQQRLDRFADITGQSLAWLNLLMVLLVSLVVLLRYSLDIHSMLMLDSALYLHATLFLLASAWTLRMDEHVRVDIFYQGFNPRQRAWVNLTGTLLLLFPVMLFLLWSSWPYVSASWATLERSNDAAALPFVYVLKSLIPLMAGLMLLQGLSEILRQLLILQGGHSRQDDQAERPV